MRWCLESPGQRRQEPSVVRQLPCHPLRAWRVSPEQGRRSHPPPPGVTAGRALPLTGSGPVGRDSSWFRFGSLERRAASTPSSQALDLVRERLPLAPRAPPQRAWEAWASTPRSSSTKGHGGGAGGARGSHRLFPGKPGPDPVLQKGIEASGLSSLARWGPPLAPSLPAPPSRPGGRGGAEY